VFTVHLEQLNVLQFRKVKAVEILVALRILKIITIYLHEILSN